MSNEIESNEIAQATAASVETQAARIAELEAENQQLQAALEATMEELEKLPSRIGQPVKVQYPFQNGNEVYTG